MFSGSPIVQGSATRLVAGNVVSPLAGPARSHGRKNDDSCKHCFLNLEAHSGVALAGTRAHDAAPETLNAAPRPIRGVAGKRLGCIRLWHSHFSRPHSWYASSSSVEDVQADGSRTRRSTAKPEKLSVKSPVAAGRSCDLSVMVRQGRVLINRFGRRPLTISAIPPYADLTRTSREVREGPISEVGEPFPHFKSEVSHASMTDPTRYSSSARRQAPGLTPTMPVNTRVRWL